MEAFFLTSDFWLNMIQIYAKIDDRKSEKSECRVAIATPQAGM